MEELDQKVERLFNKAIEDQGRMNIVKMELSDIVQELLKKQTNLPTNKKEHLASLGNGVNIFCYSIGKDIDLCLTLTHNNIVKVEIDSPRVLSPSVFKFEITDIRDYQVVT